MQVSPSSNVQDLINAHSDGTTFCFSTGLYSTGFPWGPKGSDKLIGAGKGKSILDGGGAATEAIIAYQGSGVTNVTLSGFTIRNFSDNWVGCVKAAESWTISYVEIAYCDLGIRVGASDLLQYSSLHDNRIAAVYGNDPNIVIDSNEIGPRNNSSHNPDGVFKIHGCSVCSTSVRITNNYSHDNYGVGLWCDGCEGTAIFEGNTVKNNFSVGIDCEVSLNCQIDNNILADNDAENIGQSPWWGGQIWIGTSQNVEINGNIIDSSNGANAIALVNSSRSDRPRGGLKNVSVHNNTITAKGASVSGLVGDTIPTGISMDYNTWTVDSLSAAHWYWMSGPFTWPQIRAAGQESHGTHHPITAELWRRRTRWHTGGLRREHGPDGVGNSGIIDNTWTRLIRYAARSRAL